MSDLMKKQDLLQYIRHRKHFIAKKIAKVKAIQVSESTVIETIMNDGHVETLNVAKPGDYVVTNPSGEQYVIKEKDFANRYTLISGNTYKAKGDPVLVCQIDHDITFMAPWNERMNIKKGGYLVISNPDDIYGIQEAEFNKTYEIISQ